MPKRKWSISGPEAAKLIGISYRQIDYWDRIELVKPSVNKAAGSGSQRRYSMEDLMALSVVKTLNYLGFGFDWVRTILGDVDGELLRADDNYLLVIGKNDARVLDISQIKGSLTDEIRVIIPLVILREALQERLQSVG